MEIAPGIRRIGTGLVNVYLFAEAGEVTIVDAGAPGYWRDLPAELAAVGASLDDVRAVILTHAHSDHVGFAERIRRERGVGIRVHEDDARLARGEVKPTRDPQHGGVGGIHLPLLSFFLYGIRTGMTRIPPIAEVATFGDGATLDVPGSPRVIHVPGHSEGSVAFHVAAVDAVFIGDAIATRNVVTGATGPQLAPFGADYREAMRSLDRLDGIEARVVLPGHGEPWTGGVTAALQAARAASADLAA